MKRQQIIAVVFVFCLATSTPAEIVVAPGGFENSFGDSGGNAFPFSGGFGGSSMRMQQVFDAGFFAGSGTITHLAFRASENTSFAGGTFPDIEFSLSTTTGTVDGLSTNFASNSGADALSVYSGALTWGVSDSTSFDLIVPLSNPFFYDPTAGNLLLDISRNGGSFDLFADSLGSNSDGLSRVVSSPGQGGNASGNLSTTGLITEFTFSGPLSVPEPASACMFGLACSLGLSRRRR